MSKVQRKESKALKATAYHEAGHAVAAFLLDCSIGTATIIPNKKTNSLGHCVIHIPKWLRQSSEQVHGIGKFAPNARRFEWIRRRSITLLAGQEAEKLVTGRYNRVGALDDHETLDKIVTYLYLNDQKACDLYIELQCVSARNLVSGILGRACIDAVASALLEKRTLKRGEIDSICRHAQGYSRKE